jgi:hypothetical protein
MVSISVNAPTKKTTLHLHFVKTPEWTDLSLSIQSNILLRFGMTQGWFYFGKDLKFEKRLLSLIYETNKTNFYIWK